MAGRDGRFRPSDLAAPFPSPAARFVNPRLRFIRRFGSAALIVACGVPWLLVAAQAPSAIGSPARGAQPALVFDTAMLARADSGRILGSAQAGVWVVVLSDFQCPYCKAWHDATDAMLRARYVNTGKVRIAFLNFPLPMHANAPAAADLAMCAAAQRKFWGVHDALFASQERWAKLADPAPVLDSVAGQQGVDRAALRRCVAERKLRPLVDADVNRGMRAGVNSTPSFFVGDTAFSGNVPPEEFTRVLDMMVARAAARAAAPAGARSPVKSPTKAPAAAKAPAKPNH